MLNAHLVDAHIVYTGASEHATRSYVSLVILLIAMTVFLSTLYTYTQTLHPSLSLALLLSTHAAHAHNPHTHCAKHALVYTGTARHKMLCFSPLGKKQMEWYGIHTIRT